MPLAMQERAQTAEMDYTSTSTSIPLTSGEPTTEIQKYVTPRTKGPKMLQDIVFAFAEGHEAVKLLHTCSYVFLKPVHQSRCISDD